MNTRLNPVPESPAASQPSAPVTIPVTRLLYWSVLRELWEYRSIYLAPAAAAAIYLVGFLISLIGLPHKMRLGLTAPTAPHQHDGVLMPYHLVAALIMGTSVIVALFYCLDALYGERRDRTILFWKSLPVSDVVTVLSKLCIPLLVIQSVAFVVTFITQSIMLGASCAVLAVSGLGVASLWNSLSFFDNAAMLLYHLLTVHVLWYTPIYAYLILVSAWARRAPFLWALLPPIAIGVLEKLLFNSNHFVQFLNYRLTGGPERANMGPSGDFPGPGMHPTLGHFLASPGLWLGLLVAAGFLASAVHLRHSREPL